MREMKVETCINLPQTHQSTCACTTIDRYQILSVASIEGTTIGVTLLLLTDKLIASVSYHHYPSAIFFFFLFSGSLHDVLVTVYG